jgi:hypothetical protein
MMSTVMCTDMLETILQWLPENVNMINEVNFDKELEKKNYKPYVYYDKQRGILKVFRVNKKNLETLFAVYDYGELQSPYINRFEAYLFLDKDRDSKVIKVLPQQLQKDFKSNAFGVINFSSFKEFYNILEQLNGKINWG